MEEIVITNIDTVKADATELRDQAAKLEEIKTTIDTALNETKTAWEQSQADAQKYSQELTDDMKYLTELISCNKDFSVAIINYIEATKTTSTKTI